MQDLTTHSNKRQNVSPIVLWSRVGRPRLSKHLELSLGTISDSDDRGLVVVSLASTSYLYSIARFETSADKRVLDLNIRSLGSDGYLSPTPRFLET